MAFSGFFARRNSPGPAAGSDYDPLYERDRRAIDMKLKGTFERIFEKYAKDFSHVGDEIDMETGRVVVDNGHLTYMQNERDTGKSASSRFVRAFAEELEEEPAEDSEGQAEVDHDDEDEDGHEYEADLNDPDGEGYMEEATGEEAGDEQSVDREGVRDDDEQDELTLDPLLAQTHPGTGRSQYHKTSVIPSTELSHSLAAPLPLSIADSLSALAPHQNAAGVVDPAAIQALGQNIASQIATFLSRATSGTQQQPPQRRARNNLWTAPPLPQDAFTPPDHHYREPTPQPHRHASPFESPSGEASLWADPTASRRKRRRILSQSIDDASRGSRAGSETGSERRSGGGRHDYSQHEDDMIKRLRDTDGMTWEQITTHMPGRTVGGVSGRYSRILKHMTHPVIVKREVIEIVHAEDGIFATPGPQVSAIVPGSGPEAFVSPRRPLPNTPLLRQALDNQIARNGDTGELPIMIDDDDDDENDNGSQRESSSAPSAEVYPDGHGGHYRVQHVVNPPAAPNLYTSASPDTASQAVNTLGDTLDPEPQKYRGPSTIGPRYRTFDTSLGAGNFGMLRTNNPQHFAPQANMLGPIHHAATGGFGMLRMGPEKKPKEKKPKEKKPKEKKLNPAKPAASSSQITKPPEPHKEPQSSTRTQPTLPRYDGADSTPEAPMPDRTGPILSRPSFNNPSLDTTMRAPPLPQDPILSTPIRTNTTTLHDSANDGDVSSTNTPNTTSRYTETTTHPNNGPYFMTALLPQTSPLINHATNNNNNNNNNNNATPTRPSPQPSTQPQTHVPSSSPPLPTPNSLPPGRGRRSRLSMALQAVKKDVLTAPGEMAKMGLLEGKGCGMPKTPPFRKMGGRSKGGGKRVVGQSGKEGDKVSANKGGEKKASVKKPQPKVQQVDVGRDDGSEDELAL